MDLSLVVREVAAEVVRPLRHRVLRPHQSLADCAYPGDERPDSFHLAALVDAEVVGIASVYRQAEDGAFGGSAWRLRGMATAPEFRGRGLGARLLGDCLERVRGAGGDELWCNARTTAAGFYERLGFERRGEEFELPGIGPHLVLFHRLGGDG